jgi:hypothetical protein
MISTQIKEATLVMTHCDGSVTYCDFIPFDFQVSYEPQGMTEISLGGYLNGGFVANPIENITRRLADALQGDYDKLSDEDKAYFQDLAQKLVLG